MSTLQVTPRAADPVSMLDFYMKKAAQEEKTRRPRQSKDEMPPPASLQGPSGENESCLCFLFEACDVLSRSHVLISATPSTDPEKRGHHMGDYIPLEELNKFLAKCDDVAAQKATKEAAEKAKMLADNVGHKLLSKMGWKEGAYLVCSICELVTYFLSVTCAFQEGILQRINQRAAHSHKLSPTPTQPQLIFAFLLKIMFQVLVWIGFVFFP